MSRRISSRDRVLSDDELRGLWTLLERFPAKHEKQAPGRKRATHDAGGKPFCPISPALAAVQRVRLLTAQRGGEVVAMRWQDLDLRTPANSPQLRQNPPFRADPDSAAPSSGPTSAARFAAGAAGRDSRRPPS
jgi:integrase